MLSYGNGKGDATNPEGRFWLGGHWVGAQAGVLMWWHWGLLCQEGRRWPLALPPALLSHQLLVHGETFTAMRQAVADGA